MCQDTGLPIIFVKLGKVEVETNLLKNRSSKIERDVFLLREDLNDIRSALDAKIENPNQNDDLEFKMLFASKNGKAYKVTTKEEAEQIKED